jgi:selina-4(15),7(11)-diene synthase
MNRSVNSMAPVPTFYCPVDPAGVHPDAAEIDRTAVQWLHDMKLGASEAHRKRLAHANFGLLSALSTPRGLRDRVQWAADFLYWGFALDDARDEPKEPERVEKVIAHVNKLHRILEAPGSRLLDDDPLAAGERLLQNRLEQFASPTQIRRYQEGMRAYYFAVLWEVTSRSGSTAPDLDTYSAMRMKSAGHPPMTAMLEIINGYELGDQEIDQPLVRALTEINWLLVAWDNDLYSYRKEAKQFSTGNNLVEIIAQTHDLPIPKAIEEALGLRDRIMCLFMRLRERALEDASPSLCQYIGDLGVWIRANIEWGTSSKRYAMSPEAPHTAWTDMPHDVDESPIPLSSIAWWWTV